MILYFKKYKDTEDGTNWGYDARCLSIDDRFANLSINIPGRKINEYSVYGQGSVIIPTYFFENRKISFTFRNRNKNGTIFTDWKDDIFLNWFYSNDIIFLIRETEKGLQKIRGYFIIKANEKYKSLTISNDIDIDFITEDAFFTSVNERAVQGNIENVLTTLNIVNNGYFTSWVLECSFTISPCTYIKMANSNYFFKIFDFSGVNIVINMRQFLFKNNEQFFMPKFEGNSFYIENGVQPFIIETNGRGTVVLKFFERFI